MHIRRKEGRIGNAIQKGKLPTVRWLALAGAVSFLLAATPETSVRPSLPPVAPAPTTTIAITGIMAGGASSLGDVLEIQNVSNSSVNVDGWKVIISNSYTAWTANTIEQTLSGSLEAGETKFWTDSLGSPTYWGSNIFWLETTSGKSWALLLDDSDNVVDFACTGWLASDVATGSITCSGGTFAVSDMWTGDGHPNLSVAEKESWQRVGASDTDTKDDWVTQCFRMWTGDGYTGGAAQSDSYQRTSSDTDSLNDWTTQTASNGGDNTGLTATTGVLITEVDANTDTGFRFLEIQNVGSASVDVSGWTVVISNYYDAWTAHTTEYTFPSSSSLAVDEIINWTDNTAAASTSVIDWGSTIAWDDTASSSDLKNWVLLLDETGDVVDFYCTDWTQAHMANAYIQTAAWGAYPVHSLGNTNHGLLLPWGGGSTTPTLSIESWVAQEGNSGTKTMWFALSLSKASSSAITVGVVTADVTATDGTDYDGIPVGFGDIPANTLTDYIKINIYGDTDIEDDETFGVEIAVAGGAAVVTVGDATGTILDDDGSESTVFMEDFEDSTFNGGDIYANDTTCVSLASRNLDNPLSNDPDGRAGIGWGNGTDGVWATSLTTANGTGCARLCLKSGATTAGSSAYSCNMITINVSLTGATNATLKYYRVENSESVHEPWNGANAGPWTGYGANGSGTGGSGSGWGDGVFISADGVNWYQLMFDNDPPDYSSGTNWNTNQVVIDIDAEAVNLAVPSFSLANFFIRIAQYDNNAWGSAGILVDDVQITSDGSWTTPPVNSAASSPQNLLQSDSSGVLGQGDSTSDTTVRFGATLSDPALDLVQLEIEVQPTTTTVFTGSPTAVSSYVLSGNDVEVSVTNLSPGSYHTQYRTVDIWGFASAWVEYGTTGTDFVVLGSAANNPPTVDVVTTPGSLSPMQYDNSGNEIATGGSTVDTTLTFKAKVSDADTGQTVTITVEATPINYDWGGAGTLTGTSTAVSSGSYAEVSISSFNPGTSYYWRVNATDSLGLVSTSYTSYGSNNDWTSGSYADTDFMIDPGTVNNPPTVDVVTTSGSLSPMQYDTSQNEISTGGATTDTQLTFKAKVSDPDTGQTITITVEATPVGVNWGGAGTLTGTSSSSVSSGSYAEVSISPFVAGTEYYWRVKATDSLGLDSTAWKSYGGNNDWTSGTNADTDFSVIAGNNPPTIQAGSPAQYDGSNVVIAQGGVTSDTTLIFKAIPLDADTGQTVKLQVRAAPVNEAFGLSATLTGETGFISPGTTASVTLSSVPDGDFWWQAQAVDSAGGASGWVSFGTNTDYIPAAGSNPAVNAGTDFTVDTTGGSGGSYCAASGTTGTGYISQVTIVDSLGNTVLSNSSGDDAYADYTSTTGLNAGMTKDRVHTITVDTTSTSGYTCYLYVDWNGNMVFEAGETLPMVASGSSFSVAFTPTVTGTTRLRIRLWGGVWVPDSCGTFSTGEVEDYATTITGASSQGPGTGTGGSGGSSSGCFGSVTNIPMKALDWGLLTLISLLLLFGVRRRI